MKNKLFVNSIFVGVLILLLSVAYVFAIAPEVSQVDTTNLTIIGRGEYTLNTSLVSGAVWNVSSGLSIVATHVQGANSSYNVSFSNETVSNVTFFAHFRGSVDGGVSHNDTAGSDANDTDFFDLIGVHNDYTDCIDKDPLATCGFNAGSMNATIWNFTWDVGINPNNHVSTWRNGFYNLTFSFNATAYGAGTGGVYNQSGTNYTTNTTIINVIVDKQAPQLANANYSIRPDNGTVNDVVILTPANITNHTTLAGNTPFKIQVQYSSTSTHNGTANTTVYYVLNKTDGTGSGWLLMTRDSIVGINESSTGSQNGSLSSSNATTLGRWTATIDISNLTEGFYNLSIASVDNSTNDTIEQNKNSNLQFASAAYTINQSVVSNISVDKAPIVTLDDSDDSDKNIEVSQSIKWTCTNTDNVNGGLSTNVVVTKPSGATVTKTSSPATFTGSDTNEAGTYDVKCTVSEQGFGNFSTTTASKSFQAQYSSDGGSSGGSGGGGGGSGGSSSGVTSVTQESLATETSSALSSIESNAVSDTSTATVITGTASTTQTLSQGSGVAISLQSLSGLTGTDLKEAIHSLYVEKVTSTSVTVVIASDPLKATISVGQSKKFDLNRDGTSDVEVKLNSVDGKDADLTITRLSEGADKLVIVPTVAEEAEEVAPSVAEGQPPVTGKPKMNTGLIVTIVVVLVVIVLAAVLMRKKK